MSVGRRRELVETSNPKLSIVRQCGLLGISRSGRYYQPTGENAESLMLMRLIDEAWLDCPYYGARQMMRHLLRLGHKTGRHRVARLMRKMGLAAIWQKPNTSKPNPEHKIYPYLLRELAITRPNQVWCMDITYIAMAKGFLYLAAVMDWASRRVLSWRLSNTMDVAFCVEALQEALAQHGKPGIFNTDQGSLPGFDPGITSAAFTQVLKDAGIAISMDGRGRWMDNVFIERLWRSLKYECVYLHAFETGQDLYAGLSRYIRHYNGARPHSSLAGRTPDEVYHQPALPASPGLARKTLADEKLAA
jgi:putative transposase